MSLLARIKEDSVAARKLKVIEAPFLVTLYSEASRPGLDDGKRESTDEEVVKVVKKFTDGAKELLKAAQSVDDQEKISMCLAEIDILSRYTPEQLTEDQLVVEIGKIVELVGKDVKNMGKVMTALKSAFGGKYDGALASKIVKETLTS